MSSMSEYQYVIIVMQPPWYDCIITEKYQKDHSRHKTLWLDRPVAYKLFLPFIKVMWIV